MVSFHPNGSVIVGAEAAATVCGETARADGYRRIRTALSPETPAPEAAENPEDELRRRAERRRRPMGDGREDAGREGGRHTWRREETRSGRHALRR